MYYDLQKVNVFNSVLLANWKKANYLLCSHFLSHGCLALPGERVIGNIIWSEKHWNKKRGEKSEDIHVIKWMELVSNKRLFWEQCPDGHHTLPFSHCPCPGTVVEVNPPGPDFTSYSSETMLAVGFLSVWLSLMFYHFLSWHQTVISIVSYKWGNPEDLRCAVLDVAG